MFVTRVEIAVFAHFHRSSGRKSLSDSPRFSILAARNSRPGSFPMYLREKKFICLAISEAHAGSDVMGLQTTAVKSEDGKEWIINGARAFFRKD